METVGTGHKYDVFVTYAHADNEIPEASSAKFGWVTTFARNLNIAPNVYRKNLFIKTARLWQCEVCGSVDEIATKMAKAVGRELTEEERRRFGVP